uniref:Alpha 1,4-glycosyltransferase domain-containing protein n=1 Tax=Lotharella globosa TaxID=91324 RepID=A0A7S3YQI4_9EUKA
MWKTTKIQITFQPFVKSWARLHPFWEYRFWTDASGEDFVKSVYPKYWDLFEGFNGIQRSDALRYFILHHYGGVYADLDVEPVKPLDSMLNNTLTLSQEPLAHAVVLENRDRQVCNAFMASPVGHPFWPYVHQYMNDHQIRQDPVGSTGPRMLDAALDAYNNIDFNKPTIIPTKDQYSSINHHNKNTQETATTSRWGRGYGGWKGYRKKARANQKKTWEKVNLTEATWEEVYVAPPEEYMPLFDDKLNDFSQKCQKWGLSQKQKDYCNVMKKRNYENRIEDNTLTVHHWSHTWLGHVTEQDFIDVWDLVNSTKQRYLHNTHWNALLEGQAGYKNNVEAEGTTDDNDNENENSEH